MLNLLGLLVFLIIAPVWAEQNQGDFQFPFESPPQVVYIPEGESGDLEALASTRQTCTEIPSFQVTDRRGEIPFTVTLCNKTCPGEFVSWLWDFGDNDNSTQETCVTHTYTVQGVYLVRLIGIRADGSTAMGLSFKGPIIEGEDSMISATVPSNRTIMVILKTSSTERNWIFFEVPSIFPGLTFARPEWEFCWENGRWLFLFSGDNGQVFTPEAPILHFDDPYPLSRVHFLVGDFTGAGSFTIRSEGGSSPDSLTLIQSITVNEPSGP
jgi:hypothetical protein